MMALSAFLACHYSPNFFVDCEFHGFYVHGAALDRIAENIIIFRDESVSAFCSFSEPPIVFVVSPLHHFQNVKIVLSFFICSIVIKFESLAYV